ncbi:MAG: SDR family NAD(P)-dependent oxidoreductase [Alphaproteobacteria bacterium]|nr:MAG: SDR family NAD(P)-dependent oxidoreductase [Alphaproteobacteria bacterium]
MKKPQSILITGASSGIGAALAQHYAAPGVTLFLSGRNHARLAEVEDACRSSGALVDGRIIDVCGELDLTVWIHQCDEIAPLDLVIANAGVGLGNTDGANLHDVAKRTFEANVGGVFNTIHPAVDCMRKRGQGQIALVSSIAAYQGLAGSPAYSASKAAVKTYGEALRAMLRPENITVSVICPGYVRSRITDRNDYFMPFFMEADKAARIIATALAKGKGRITFPWPMVPVARILTNLPMWLLDLVNRPMGTKRAED